MATNFTDKNISSIQLKNEKYHIKSVPFHATEEEWSSTLASYVPKQGEIVVYDTDDRNDIKRFKIGDGITNVNDLSFFGTNGEISWNDLKGRPFGKIKDRLEWDGNVPYKAPVIDIYGGQFVKTFDECFYYDELDNNLKEGKKYVVYIQLENEEVIAIPVYDLPSDYGPLKNVWIGLHTYTGTNRVGFTLNYNNKEDGSHYGRNIIDFFSNDQTIYEPGTYFFKGTFPSSDGNEYNGYICGLEMEGYKFTKTIAENTELLGRIKTENGGVPEINDSSNGAVLCNVDGTPAWKKLEELNGKQGQGLIELYDPKDSLFIWDSTNEKYNISEKKYKVFDGKLDIEDYINGGSIIYEDSGGLKIIEFICHDASISNSVNSEGKMVLWYHSDDPYGDFDISVMDFSTYDAINGAHYYSKDDEDKPQGLYFTWFTSKNNTSINVKGLYLNGCKKFIKPQTYNVEYTDSFTFNGDLKDKPEMMVTPFGSNSGGNYWISDAVFTADDFKNGCPCRFIDSTGLHSNVEWNTEWSCAVREEEHYVDIVYTDENGNTINIGYCCLEGSSYPPGFYMTNSDDFKILGFSVPGVKKFPKKKISKEELAHKGKTYSNSISWDYDMENRESFEYGFYKISDEHFTLEDLKDGYFVEYCPTQVYEGNYGYAYAVDETQCWAEMQGGCTNICTTDENGNTYATIVSVPEGFLQSPGTYFYCDDWYFNAPVSLTVRGFKKFIGDISSEEAVSPIAKREKTNVLTWDGIITDPSNLQVIGWKEDESNHYWNYAFFYKVSNAVITLEDLKDGVRTRTYFIEDNGWIDIPFDENEIHLRKDGSIQIYCYDANGNHVDGWDIYCYPENSTYPAGVYFGCSRDVFYSSYKLDDYVSGFEIPNVYKFNVINKIDGKYLSDYNDIPNIPVGILPTGGDTLYWDGNTEGLESIENGTFFKVTDAFDADQLSEYDSKLIEYNPSPNGGTIVEEVSMRQNDDPRSFSFCGFDGEGNEYVLAHINGNGVYFAKDVNGYMRIHSLTVPGFKKFPLLKKLDKKYLPDYDDVLLNTSIIHGGTW